VLTSFFYSEKRDQLFDFTHVMWHVPASIFVKAERPDIKELHDLAHKRIAMQKGDYAKEFLESKNIPFDAVHTNNFAEAADLVIAGKADAMIGDEEIVLYHVFKDGLSMVYGIVKSHGGYITCYSEPGEGTTFKIYFPVKVGVPTGFELKSQGDEAVPEGGSETILLVDDEEMLRDIGEHILQKFGYTVLLARDGESALALYQEKPEHIALVILDLIMPGMGGKRCLEEILKISPGANVVIASGYSANAHARDVLDMGARAFVTKPYEINQLLGVVRKVLENQSPISAI
jgi:CheY-like chemotaxis protein